MIWQCYVSFGLSRIDGFDRALRDITDNIAYTQLFFSDKFMYFSDA
jgi:hypothetical protein